MEDIVQRVFAIMFAVIVFFIMPLYMTFEKKDDISYALALKITSNFVDTVKAKGYLTQQMYDDYLSELAVTDNYYDVKMIYKHKVYNPVILVRKGKEVVDTLDYSLYEDQYNAAINSTNGIIKAKYYDEEFQRSREISYKGKDGYTFELSYKLGEIIYNEDQILAYFRQQENKTNYFTMKLGDYQSLDLRKIPNNPVNYVTKDNRAIFKMSVGDEFTIAVRNTNVTIASILFDALTFGGMAKDMPRVYVNYGAVVKNTEFTELADEFTPYDNDNDLSIIFSKEDIKQVFEKYSSSPSVKIYVGKSQKVVKTENDIPNGSFSSRVVRGYTTKIYFGS